MSIEIDLRPKKGKLKVTSIETDPTQRRLAEITDTGVTKYVDPHEVIVGNRVYYDLDLVEVRNLKAGKITLKMT